MAYWHISGWAKILYPALTWDNRDVSEDIYDPKNIYLTFDDGPTPEITQGVLEILKQYSAKATFFCLGRNAERHPEILRQIEDEGHSIGNHTYSHLKGWKTKNIDYFQDIELAGTIINSRLFRPPYGQIKRSQVRYLKQKYKIIMWDVMSHDYESRISKDRKLRLVLKYTTSGSIVVFHDSVKARNNLFYILPRVLETFVGKGFNLKSIV